MNKVVANKSATHALLSAAHMFVWLPLKLLKL